MDLIASALPVTGSIAPLQCDLEYGSIDGIPARWTDKKGRKAADAEERQKMSKGARRRRNKAGTAWASVPDAALDVDNSWGGLNEVR